MPQLPNPFTNKPFDWATGAVCLWCIKPDQSYITFMCPAMYTDGITVNNARDRAFSHFKIWDICYSKRYSRL